MVRPEGLEPPTLGSEVRCSIQLSYGRARRYKNHVTRSLSRTAATPFSEPVCLPTTYGTGLCNIACLIRSITWAIEISSVSTT